MENVDERIVQLKSEIARVSLQVQSLKADKKAEVKSFTDLIKDKESELEVHLNELKELQKR